MFPENRYQERVFASKLTQTSNEIFPSNCTADPMMLSPTPHPSVGVTRFTDTLSPIPLQIPGSIVDLDELWEDPFQIYELEQHSLRNNDISGYCWVRPYKSGPLTPEPLSPYDRLPKCRCGLYTLGDRHLWVQSQLSQAKAQSKHKCSNHRCNRPKASKHSKPESLYGRIMKKSKKIFENFMEFLGIDVNKKDNFSDEHGKKRKRQDWLKQPYGQNRSWI